MFVGRMVAYKLCMTALMLISCQQLRAQNNGIPGQIQDLQRQIDVLQQQVASLQASNQGSTLTVTADCSKSGAITSALQSASTHAGPLVIQVNGACKESVTTSRSDTTIEGTTPDAAIIAPDTGRSPINVVGANNFHISNIALKNGASGLAAEGAHVYLTKVSVTGNTGFGILAFEGSVVSLSKVTVGSNGNGMAIERSSHLLMSGGSIAGNNGVGIQVVGSSSATLQGGVDIADNATGVMVGASSSLLIGWATVESNRFDGITAISGSSLQTGWAGGPLTVQNNGNNGIVLFDTSVAWANPGTPNPVVVQNNGGSGIQCNSAPGAPAAQLSGVGFSASGNGNGQIRCPNSN